MGYDAFGAGIYGSLARDNALNDQNGLKKMQKSLEVMYRHWNDHPSEPMNVDNGPLLKLLPNVKLTRMEDLGKQLWDPHMGDRIGSMRAPLLALELQGG